MPRFAPRPTPYDLPAVSTSPEPVRALDVWTQRGTDSFVVGDVVLVTEQCVVTFRRDGRVAMKGDRKAPEKVDDRGRAVKRRCLRRTVATVVEGKSVRIGKSEFTHRTLMLCVMWSDAEVAEEAYDVGRKIRLGQGKANQDRLKRVERLVGSGPKVRTDEAGRDHLLQRLKEAAGDRDLVAALSGTVDPLRTLEGEPVTIGDTMAGMVLDGVAPVRAWMIGQVSGRMAIPADAVDKAAKDAADEARFEAMYPDEDDDYDDGDFDA